MCYTEQTWVPTLLIGLETFLGGMETFSHLLQEYRLVNTLKPSLVEWKQPEHPAAAAGVEDPLKPSLVEWKRHRNLGIVFLPSALETFLGGMETVGVPQELPDGVPP